MTNLEYIKTYSEQKMAMLFVWLRLNGAEANEWVEFFKMPYDAEEWKKREALIRRYSHD